MNKQIIFLTLLTTILLSSCNKRIKELKYDTYDDSQYSAKVDDEGYTVIDFYGLNDFHGALTFEKSEKMPGASRLNSFLKTKRSENPGGTVLIANGDMWQGSADSNISRGKAVTHILNHMGYAAMSLGNHEFDWGIEEIKNNKAEANYPFLGANITSKTEKDLDFVDESPLIERDGVKIGIIGTIGSDLENTVQASLISDLNFDPITTFVKEESARLREAGANLIFLAAHDTWIGKVDTERQPLLDSNDVDAVFTGHQHQLDKQEINGIPILQTRGRGRDVMHISLGYNKTTNTKKLIASQIFEDIATYTLEPDKTTEDIIKYYYQSLGIAKIKSERLGKIKNEDMSLAAVANLVVKVMTETYSDDQVVGALHNVKGGIRSEFKKGTITYGDVYSAFPFDNEIYIVEVSGQRLTFLISISGNYAKYFTIKSSEVVVSQTYYVSTISFLYEIDGSPFAGLPYENTFTYPRDILASYIRTNKNIDGSAY